MVEIKDWFEKKLVQELNLPRIYSLEIFCGIKETEKAVYAMLYTGYDNAGHYGKHRCHWIPKSAIENIKDLKMIEDYEKAVFAFDMEYTN